MPPNDQLISHLGTVFDKDALDGGAGQISLVH